MVVLRHLAAYLASHQEFAFLSSGVAAMLEWNHKYDDLEPGECALEVFTDSDWASDRGSRRSISCATIFTGGCLLFSASRIQKLVSLSSAEAEVYACSSATSDAILLSRLVSWILENVQWYGCTLTPQAPVEFCKDVELDVLDICLAESFGYRPWWRLEQPSCLE